MIPYQVAKKATSVPLDCFAMDLLKFSGVSLVWGGQEERESFSKLTTLIQSPQQSSPRGFIEATSRHLVRTRRRRSLREHGWSLTENFASSNPAKTEEASKAVETNAVVDVNFMTELVGYDMTRYGRRTRATTPKWALSPQRRRGTTTTTPRDSGRDYSTLTV